MAFASTGLVTRLLGTESFAALMENGCIEIRSGAPPASADAEATGTLLARITRDGGAWNAGNPANGLQWRRDGRYMIQEPGHEWRLTGIATGTASWFRLLANPFDSGIASLTALRVDGSIAAVGGTTPADLYLPTLSIAPGYDRRVDAFWLSIY